jgi:hypothetical protein
MTRISNLTAVDSRSDWGKISRRQYWRGLKALNIPYPAGATQPQMIGIAQAANLTPDQVANFVPVQVNTVDGNGKVVMVPEDHERKYDEQKEHRRAEEMERRIAAGVEKEETRISAEKQKMETEKDAEISILRSELDDMKKMMAQLLEQPVKKITDPKETDPYKMKFMAQRKWLKEHGVELSKGGNAKELIAQVLEDGKDTSDGS